MKAAPEIERDRYPEDMAAVDRWLNWEYQAGRKVPIAPHAGQPPGGSGVDPHDPENWTTFEEAQGAVEEWRQFSVNVGLAFDLPRDGAERCLIDLDDCRDASTGELVPPARALVERADSAAYVSQSGTGVHIYGKARLPDGVTAIADDLHNTDGAEIEVYDSGRFIGVTGKHIAGTPDRCTDVQDLIDLLVEEYDTKADRDSDGDGPEPALDADDLDGLDSTDEIEDVYDAIKLVAPGEIRLRSPVTNKRADGTVSRDPCWADSDSGTRLVEFEDGWATRNGMHGLDALQVVALEERIITGPQDYPSGEAFWKAVERLRERGARIPRYTGDDGATPDALGLHKEPEDTDELLEQFVAKLHVDE
jgi:hypothetical protein